MSHTLAAPSPFPKLSTRSQIVRVNICTDVCILIAVTKCAAQNLSMSDAAKRGVPGLARAAETGATFVVERNHRPVAAIIGVEQLHRYQEAERDLRDLSIVLIRSATDTGARTSLDEVMARFGVDREKVGRELDEDLAAGRE